MERERFERREFRVGDKLWMEAYPRRGGYSGEIEITRVGRKWVYFRYDDRFDKETLYADGGQFSSPGRIWFSKSDVLDDEILQDAYRKLRRAIEYGDPKPGVTLGDINAAADLLRVDIGQPKREGNPEA